MCTYLATDDASLICKRLCGLQVPQTGGEDLKNEKSTWKRVGSKGYMQEGEVISYLTTGDASVIFWRPLWPACVHASAHGSTSLKHICKSVGSKGHMQEGEMICTTAFGRPQSDSNPSPSAVSADPGKWMIATCHAVDSNLVMQQSFNIVADSNAKN